MFGNVALAHLLENYEFNKVLDVGCGSGTHTGQFRRAGKEVTPNDASYHDRIGMKTYTLEGYYAKEWMHQPSNFDCIWCCHVLEHMPNPHDALKMMRAMLRKGGVLCVTVPPLKQEIVGGHVSLWNGGLLLYNLVLAGFDCSDVWLRKYGYNISVIVRNPTEHLYDEIHRRLKYDAGDIEKIAKWMPLGCKVQGFNGDIEAIG